MNNLTMSNLPVSAKTVMHPILGFVGWLLLCYTPALIAAFISMGEWFYLLNKPAWNPPNWLFGPVWMTLYTLMAISAWLVWRQGGWAKQLRPLTFFVVQLVLNALWTPIFFGLHLPALAFFEMLLLWMMLLVTIGSFWKLHRWAAILLIPYITWVSFAAFLNFTIWRLNVP